MFPANFWPELDFSVFETLEQFEAVIRRDFEAKAPTGADILSTVESNGYLGPYELLRDLSLNLSWVNRLFRTASSAVQVAVGSERQWLAFAPAFYPALDLDPEQD